MIRQALPGSGSHARARSVLTSLAIRSAFPAPGEADFVCVATRIRVPAWNFRLRRGLLPRTGTEEAMLVERGLRVMNLDVIGKSYDIAANYLRRTGVIPDTSSTHDALLEMIVQMFQRGETNQIRLANKAIAKFEAARVAA
jgi:hypothetical protein